MWQRSVQCYFLFYFNRFSHLNLNVRSLFFVLISTFVYLFCKNTPLFTIFLYWQYTIVISSDETVPGKPWTLNSTLDFLPYDKSLFFVLEIHESLILVTERYPASSGPIPPPLPSSTILYYSLFVRSLDNQSRTSNRKWKSRYFW